RAGERDRGKTVEDHRAAQDRRDRARISGIAAIEFGKGRAGIIDGTQIILELEVERDSDGVRQRRAQKIVIGGAVIDRAGEAEVDRVARRGGGKSRRRAANRREQTRTNDMTNCHSPNPDLTCPSMVNRQWERAGSQSRECDKLAPEKMTSEK